MSLPYMPMYWGDYLGDTQHLTTIEHGGYLLLIAYYWRMGGIPSDPVQLSRICRMTAKQWERHGDTIMAFFADGKHRRIDREIEKAASKSEKMRRSAEKRWERDREAKPLETLITPDANALPMQSKSNANQNQNHNHKDIPPISAPPKERQQRGTRLPKDWMPEEHLDRQDELAAFRDYWVAQPGQRGVKLDWQATWRNWIRRAGEKRPSAAKTERDLRNVPDHLLSNDEYWRKRIQKETWK